MTKSQTAKAHLDEHLPWLTLPQVADRLSKEFEEPIGVPEILRFGLEGQLRLSVKFQEGVYAKLHRELTDAERKRGGRLQKMIRAVKRARSLGLAPPKVKKRRLTKEEQRYEQVFRLPDVVYDLPLIAGERHTIESQFQALTGRPDHDWLSIDGCFVDGEDGVRYQILARLGTTAGDYFAPGNFYPPERLPESSIIVVRRATIADFVARLSPVPALDRPVGGRERTTLLVLLGVLARLAKVDLSKPTVASRVLEKETELAGARVSARAIEDHLKRIPDAMERVRES